MNKASMVIQCPRCKQNAVLTELLQDIPNFGEALISNLHCEHCAYNFNDVMSSSSHKPVFFSARIENENDLKIKIVKSSSSFVSIPELDTEIFPSPSSDGYISNIEGLLERVKSTLAILSATRQLIQLEKALTGEISFTVELKDIYGHGALIGNKVEKKVLSEKEILELKKLFEG